jgi:hypothetical protein
MQVSVPGVPSICHESCQAIRGCPVGSWGTRWRQQDSNGLALIYFMSDFD